MGNKSKKATNDSDQDVVEKKFKRKVIIFRLLSIINIGLGLNYISWRYTHSLNMNALWFAIPLVVAETYSVIDMLLFTFMMWKPTRRTSLKPFDCSVDIYITTYNEPLHIVKMTAEAARRIHWKEKRIFILDDGNRKEISDLAKQTGCGYITRGAEWVGKQRYAKAGNINNALMQTNGDFILVLDADQIPSPQIIERCIGYFSDDQVAFVQSPQYFYNTPPGDPFGSDAPLFYGPILQGKDGWNSTFFCGSNGFLRREALLQLGLTDYVKNTEKQLRQGLNRLEKDIRKTTNLGNNDKAALAQFHKKINEARASLDAGQSFEKVAEMVHIAFREIQNTVNLNDIDSIIKDLSALDTLGDQKAGEIKEKIASQKMEISREIGKETGAQGASGEALQDFSLTRASEAQPILPMATFSITEDMATSMRLHAMGWKSVFHPEVLAYGLAPEDLGTALRQRLRWAQGTIQVLAFENPFLKKGLTFPQRLEYFTTIYSYFNGFFNLIFLLAPIVYLLTGIPPVSSWSTSFLWHLIPYLVVNKIVFRYLAQGIPVYRNDQYNLALFPVWIQAIISVYFKQKLTFHVTAKERQNIIFVKEVWPQIAIVILTLISFAFGIHTYLTGTMIPLPGLLVNIFWGCYNILMLSGIITAAFYQPPSDWHASPPEFSV